MIRLCKYPVVKLVAILVSVMFLAADVPLRQPVNNHNKLEGLFQWAKKSYLEGKHRDAAEKLELLLSFYATEGHPRHEQINSNSEKNFIGKIYLLLGAANEKMGKVKQAEIFYNNAKIRIEGTKIQDVDLGDLKGYNRIIKNSNNSGWIIAKEVPKPKKPKLGAFIILASLAVIAFGAVIVMSRKSKNDYDTRELHIEWVRVPAGTFLMGDNFGDGESDELPVHQVELPEYYISKYEITFLQYQAFIDSFNDSMNRSDSTKSMPDDSGWGKGRRPVINVSWSEAHAFCEWLSKKTGKSIKLPTEAQWERAARGITQRRYPWGDNPPDCLQANYCCREGTTIVGRQYNGVTPYDGINDMAGNVAEWCRDYYQADYYSMAPHYNPENTTASADGYQRRVVRGGSWKCDFSSGIRSSDRDFRITGSPQTEGNIFNGDNTIGFRIVWEK